MINSVVGRPRAGKSYESVIYHILPSAKEGRKVVTNIPVNLEKVSQYYGQDTADNILVVDAEFSSYGKVRPFSVPQDFTKYTWKNEKGQGVLFVVDEAHLSLGQDAKQPVLEYLSLHGHYGHDIIVVTQSPKKLHRDLKDMIEVCWRCVKKSVYGDDKHYIKKTYHGVVTRNEDFIHEEEREYQSQYFGFYKSHTQSSSAVDEAASKDISARVFPRKKLIIAMLVIGFAMAIYAGKRMISPANASESAPKADVVKVVTESVSVPSSNESYSEEIYSPSKKIKRTDTRKKESQNFHPFYKVTLHIDGMAEFTLDKYLVKEVYFVAAQNGQSMFTISTRDLRLAGYDVAVYGDCAVLVSYGDYEDWLTCDSPRVDTAVSPVTESEA